VSFAITATEFIVYCLQFLKVLIVIGILAVATVCLFRARSIRRWLRVCMRISGAILVLPLGFCVLFLIVMAACVRQPRIIISPDSQHVAEYSYMAGFLGRDVTSVNVRKKWSLIRSNAYTYAGPSDWSSTQVRWLDNERLLIRYSQDERDHPQRCNNGKLAGVFVQCEAQK
jgi:hypothetical protein